MQLTNLFLFLKLHQSVHVCFTKNDIIRTKQQATNRLQLVQYECIWFCILLPLDIEPRMATYNHARMAIWFNEAAACFAPLWTWLSEYYIGWLTGIIITWLPSASQTEQ